MKVIPFMLLNNPEEVCEHQNMIWACIIAVRQKIMSRGPAKCKSWGFSWVKKEEHNENEEDTAQNSEKRYEENRGSETTPLEA